MYSIQLANICMPLGMWYALIGPCVAATLCLESFSACPYPISEDPYWESLAGSGYQGSNLCRYIAGQIRR